MYIFRCPGVLPSTAWTEIIPRLGSRTPQAIYSEGCKIQPPNYTDLVCFAMKAGTKPIRWSSVDQLPVYPEACGPKQCVGRAKDLETPQPSLNCQTSRSRAFGQQPTANRLGEIRLAGAESKSLPSRLSWTTPSDNLRSRRYDSVILKDPAPIGDAGCP